MESKTLANGTVITKETMSVSKFLGSLMLELPWIEEKLVGLADSDKVIVTKQHAGIIGTFLVDVKAANGHF